MHLFLFTNFVGENWFQYVRRVNAIEINFPCIITLEWIGFEIVRILQCSKSNLSEKKPRNDEIKNKLTMLIIYNTVGPIKLWNRKTTNMILNSPINMKYIYFAVYTDPFNTNITLFNFRFPISQFIGSPCI